MDSSDAQPLTAREREVVRLVVEGYTTREVAELLFITPETVKTHLRDVFRKCQVRNRVQLTKWWLSHGAEPHGKTEIEGVSPGVEAAAVTRKDARRRSAFALMAVLAGVSGLLLILASDILPTPGGPSVPSSQAGFILCPPGDSTCLLEAERACRSVNPTAWPGVYECLPAQQATSNLQPPTPPPLPP